MRFSDWSSDVCSSDLDTPWHPDDYVHRIGRTGRAGAKGRAFTLVAEDDAEAIANVEKLTGCTIDVFGQKDVRVELKSRSEARRVGKEGVSTCRSLRSLHP